MAVVSLRNKVGYDDMVVAEGVKHKVVQRNGQYLVLEHGKRQPELYGDHGSTRTSRHRALAHFQMLEQPYLEE
jgi:hypothetical protein